MFLTYGYWSGAFNVHYSTIKPRCDLSRRARMSVLPASLEVGSLFQSAAPAEAGWWVVHVAVDVDGKSGSRR